MTTNEAMRAAESCIPGELHWDDELTRNAAARIEEITNLPALLAVAEAAREAEEWARQVSERGSHDVHPGVKRAAVGVAARLRSALAALDPPRKVTATECAQSEPGPSEMAADMLRKCIDDELRKETK